MATFSAPGLDLANATNSAKVFTGSDIGTSTRCGEYAIIVTGAKSRKGLNGKLATTAGALVRPPTSVKSIV